MGKQKPKTARSIRRKETVNKSQTSSKGMIFGYDWLYLLPVICLGLLIYSNVYDCSFQFDDKHNITDNPAIRDLSRWADMWDINPARFLPFYSFALNYHFHELEVAGYHIVNVLIHLVNSCLVFWLTVSLFRTPVLSTSTLAPQSKSFALLVALLFVSHPLATGSVTYIVQRMASMVAMFYFLSLMLYVKGRLEDSKTKYWYFAGAGLSMLAALLSKENAFTLPLVILLVEMFLFNTQRQPINLKDKRVIFGGLGILLLGVFALIFLSSKFLKPLPPSIYNPETITPGNYFLTQFRVIVKYIQLLILPIGQNIDYDIRISKSLFELPTLLNGIVLLLILATGVFLYNRNRLISFGIFWFFATISIESSFIPINDLMFEHRTYIPSLGFFWVLLGVICHVFRRSGQAKVWTTASLMILCFSVMAHQRNAVWKTDVTLWSDAIEKSPLKARPYINRGYAYARIQRWNQAIQDFQKVNELFPNQHATAYYNLGLIYWTLDKKGLSFEQYTKAIQVDPKNPEYHYARAVSYYYINDMESALRDYNAAIELNPKYEKAYFSRGILYGMQKKWDLAILDYSKGIALAPSNFNFYYNRGMVYGNIGQWEKAEADFEKVIALDPKNKSAYNYLDMARSRKNESVGN